MTYRTVISRTLL